METLRAAPKVRALRNVVQNVVIAVQDGVDEANGAFADCSALLVQLKSVHVCQENEASHA